MSLTWMGSKPPSALRPKISSGLLIPSTPPKRSISLKDKDLHEQIFDSYLQAEMSSMKLLDTLDKIVDQRQNLEGFHGNENAQETEVDLFYRTSVSAGAK